MASCRRCRVSPTLSFFSNLILTGETQRFFWNRAKSWRRVQAWQAIFLTRWFFHLSSPVFGFHWGTSLWGTSGAISWPFVADSVFEEWASTNCANSNPRVVKTKQLLGLKLPL